MVTAIIAAHVSSDESSEAATGELVIHITIFPISHYNSPDTIDGGGSSRQQADGGEPLLWAT